MRVSRRVCLAFSVYNVTTTLFCFEDFLCFRILFCVWYFFSLKILLYALCCIFFLFTIVFWDVALCLQFCFVFRLRFCFAILFCIANLFFRILCFLCFGILFYVLGLWDFVLGS